MRSIYLSICTLLASAALLASCNDDQLIESNHTSIPSETISFGATVGWPEDDPDSRALNRVGKYMLSSEEVGDLLPLGVYVQEGIHPVNEDTPQSRGAVISIDDLDNFKVWATYTNTDNESTSFFGNTGLEFSENNGVYSSTDIYYWPGSGAFEFVALGNVPDDNFTVSADGTSLTYTVPDNATKQKDIIMAVASAAGNYNQTVPLTFNHILTAVNVKIGDVPAGTINSITFKNIYSKGTYEYVDGVAGWTTSKLADLHDYSVIFNEDALNSEGKYVTDNQASGTLINGNDATFMMIPQTLESGTNTPVEMVVNFTHSATGNTEDLHASLEGHVWSMGNTTNYMIDITPDFVLDIVETSVPIADCHYDTRIINISDESNVGWTLSSDVDWVKFRVMPADYNQATGNYADYRDYWIEEHTVVKVDITMDQTKEDNTATDEDERITTNTTTATYPIEKSISGIGDATIIAYYYENTGSSDENTARTTTLYLKDNKGYVRDDIEIQQYYPLWGTGNIAYERIEEYKDTYPWGFASTRSVPYTYPNCEQKPSWATGFLGGSIWAIIEWLGWDEWFYQTAKETRGSVYNEFYTNYYMKAPTGFITISPSGGDGTTDWGKNNAWSVILDYSKLNDITANSTSGLTNTQTILTYGGGETGSDAETYLISKSLIKGTESSNTDNTTIPQTAAYQAVKKNRWNITTTITTTTTITKEYGTQVDEPKYDYGTPVLVDDNIKWFLPSNNEIASLKATACDTDASNNDEALSGTYWTSTSAANVTAYEYAADATTGTPVSRVATTKHKIRAARIKP